ncbi:uncharacterized protein B0H18DRAFT_604888 [Fomitopsis serialis]|uniref:uncharacterized protein n=1 Tax=Fomitopsis serialis TaxID=139415 RepID=UPI00200891A2|nr:uncharacterized protein B0H18DRAFT_604888 [Neoantrodia serialis]KAH9933889.1 hypothetical protein B0H18DRAFT_604888 [Neoantrodia serialis]
MGNCQFTTYAIITYEQPKVYAVLRYRNGEFEARHAIMTALDGIPATMVRRQGLSLIQPDGRRSQADGAGFIDCAVVYTQTAYYTEPDAPSSKKLNRLPINMFNPALMLVAQGPSGWDTLHPAPALDMQLVLHRLANNATVSLLSMIRACTA